MEVIHYLESWNNISIVIRLFLAMLFGALIGLERSTQKHNTGARTFALVSLGAALATMLNIYLVTMDGHSYSADISRIPAGVVSGIGFLGAGCILVTGRNQVKGISTAASLWVTAIMGMALGAGFVIASSVCFVLVLASNTLLQKVSHHVEENNRLMSICLEVDRAKGVQKLRKELSDTGYQVLSMNKTKQKPLNEADVVVVVDLNLGKKKSHREVLDHLGGLEYVDYIEEI